MKVEITTEKETWEMKVLYSRQEVEEEEEEKEEEEEEKER